MGAARLHAAAALPGDQGRPPPDRGGLGARPPAALQDVAAALHRRPDAGPAPDPRVVAAIAVEREERLPSCADDFGRAHNARRAAAARERVLPTDGSRPESGSAWPAGVVARQRHRLAGDVGGDGSARGDLLYASYAEAWAHNARAEAAARAAAAEAPPAGLSARASDGGAGGALAWAPAPPTPARVERYRKAAKKPIGASSRGFTQNPKTAKEVRDGVGPAGRGSHGGRGGGGGAREALTGWGPGNAQTASLSAAEATRLRALEATYVKCLDSRRRHVLGAPLSRGADYLPAAVKAPAFAFGSVRAETRAETNDPDPKAGGRSGSVAPLRDGTAKSLLFPDGKRGWAERERGPFHAGTLGPQGAPGEEERRPPPGAQTRRGYAFPGGVDGYTELRFGARADPESGPGNRPRSAGARRDGFGDETPLPGGVAGCLQTFPAGPRDAHTFVVSRAQREAWRRGVHVGRVRTQASSDYGRAFRPARGEDPDPPNGKYYAAFCGRSKSPPPPGPALDPATLPPGGLPPRRGSVRGRCDVGAAGHGDGHLAVEGGAVADEVPQGLYADDVASAATVIRGRYSEVELRPDVDLGRAVRRGHRNVPLPGDEDRAFGVPSRAASAAGRRGGLGPGDVPGVAVEDVLAPSRFEALGVRGVVEAHLEEALPVDEVRGVFAGVGLTFSDDEFRRIARRARAVMAEGAKTQASAGVSIAAFRRASNEYLDAVKGQTDAVRNKYAPRMLPAWWTED
jgi:hypothetical protein